MVVFHRIRISDKAISENVGRTALVSIPREQVTRVEVAYGTIAERPLFMSLCGAVITLFGLFGLVYVVNGGRLLKTGVGSMAGLILGPLLVWSAIRHGPVLLVSTAKTTRKLGFGAKIDPSALRTFIAEAREVGVEIATRQSDRGTER